MDLRRLKTIFIFILIILNLALGIMVYDIIRQDREIASITRDNVEKLLERDMIYLAPNLEFLKSPEIYNIYLERTSADNDEFAARILGSKYYTNDNGVYSCDSKSLEIHGDEFIYKNAAPQNPISDFSPKKIEELCRNEMRILGMKSDIYQFGGTNQIENGVRAVFTMQHGDDVFFDAYITFDISTNGIRAISGKNPISNLTSSAISEQYVSLSSVLLEVAKSPYYEKNKKMVIVSVKHGYYIGGDIETFSNILAIPVWQIVTDSGNILYYDARNGQYIG